MTLFKGTLPTRFIKRFSGHLISFYKMLLQIMMCAFLSQYCVSSVIVSYMTVQFESRLFCVAIFL